MINVIISGSEGRMGKILTELINLNNEFNLVCKIDIKEAENTVISEKLTLSAAAEANVILDFSSDECLSTLCQKLLDFDCNTSLVSGTTALSDTTTDLMKKLSSKSNVFYASNMSLGIAVLKKLSSIAAKALYENYDIEIMEIHHNKKKDSPSGTAAAILEEIKKVKTDVVEKYGRKGKAELRNKNEIGVHSLRLGNISGIHKVFFGGEYETLSITHEAESRKVFALGALEAAKFIINQNNQKIYDMEDLIEI